ncbi:MAG: GIY-YIG nuclease family protein [Verrucomicrobiia bacterium]
MGFTEDLQDRLKTHNAGPVPHTIKFRPWRIKTAIAFTEHQHAIDFERYLKTGSGRAFAKKAPLNSSLSASLRATVPQASFKTGLPFP